ncbi:MAG: ribose 5-phosphate isomerase B, partial [Acidobacteriota bacterium]
LTVVREVSYYSVSASIAGASMQISIGCDHAGFELKEKLKQFLQDTEHQIVDEGTFNGESTDYPDFAASVAQAVSQGRSDRGILVCGTGIGMSIAANKLPRVRAALCHSVETAHLSRQHNDANVLAIGARVLDTDLAVAITSEWLKTEFEGGRHQARLDKIELLEALQDKGVTEVE